MVKTKPKVCLQVVDPNGLVFSGEQIYYPGNLASDPFELKNPVDQGGSPPTAQIVMLTDKKRWASDFLCNVSLPGVGGKDKKLLFYLPEPSQKGGLVKKNAIIPQELGRFSPWVATLSFEKP